MYQCSTILYYWHCITYSARQTKNVINHKTFLNRHDSFPRPRPAMFCGKANAHLCHCNNQWSHPWGTGTKQMVLFYNRGNVSIYLRTEASGLDRGAKGLNAGCTRVKKNIIESHCKLNVVNCTTLESYQSTQAHRRCSWVGQWEDIPKQYMKNRQIRKQGDVLV